MSKNKKGKVVSLKPAQLSAEKYIQTQARSLPVFECLITREWQNTGICSIVVARRHITGNITAGIYLVDLYCLGLKSTAYQFNISPDEYSVYSDKYAMDTCEYVIAHNIIYGAIAYAEDYGFKPDKDFDVSRFILEEDDERVAEIEIEFGLDGRPCFMPGPDDSEAQIRKVIATLERTAGPGNFDVIDDFNADDEFDDDEFVDGGEFDDYDEDETREPSISELTEMLKNINKVYDGLVRKPGTKKTENTPVGKGYKVSKGKVKNEYTMFEDAEQEETYNALRKLVMDGQNPQLTVKSIKEAILKYPTKPAFYDLLLPLYHFNGMFNERDNLVTDMYKLFPDYLFPKIAYANLLINQGKAKEVLAVFSGKRDLNDLFPDRKVFFMTEAADYYACMCRYFIAVDNIDSADLYVNALFEKKLTDIPGMSLAKTAMMELCKAKVKKIEEVGGIKF